MRTCIAIQMRTLHKERSAYVNRQDGISWYVAPE